MVKYLGISTVEEYKEIQPEGNYIVLNDLDFRNPSTTSWIKDKRRYQISRKHKF